MRRFLRRWLAVALVTATVIARPARAEGPRDGVDDQVGLFSRAAVERADAHIHALRERSGVGMFIETIPEAPPRERKHIPLLDRAREENRFMHAWARQRAKELGVDGVFVVICNSPRDVRVVAWPESRTHEFTVGDCEELRLKFAGAPGAGFLKRWWRDLTGKNPEIPQAEHDRYLQAGIDCFDAMLQAKHPAGDAGTVIGLPELAVLLLAPVALWLVLVAVLWRVNRRGGERPAGSSERTAAMLGALFGVPAGFAVYDRMFKGAPPGKPLADASELFPPPPPAPPAEGEGEPPERPTR